MFEAEIRQIVTDRTATRDRVVSSQEIVAALIDAWGVHGEQDLRYQLATWSTIRDEVKSVIRSMKRKMDLPEAERELFESKHLQSLYVVDLGGDSQIVPLDLMSEEQIELKIAEHRAQGKGHFEHARELEKFAAEKFRRSENSLFEVVQ